MEYRSITHWIRSHTRDHTDDNTCYICGNKKTENHHLYKVADLANICVSNEYFDLDSLYIPSVSLCNLHHTKWHILNGDMNKRTIITPEEIDKFIDLAGEFMAICDEIPAELQDDYIDLYIDTIDRINDNMIQYIDSSIRNEYDIKQSLD